MSPALVRRFQSPDGRGPFIDGPFNGWRNGSITNPDWLEMALMPMPYDDGLEGVTDLFNDERRYAFATDEQLQQWVTLRDQKKLTSKGFKVAYFMVPPSQVKWGGNQVAFKADASMRVEALD